MPLYLVRWPNLDLALVKARDEEALMDILDEVCDPSCATWTEYRGPLYIGFKSPVTVRTSGPGEDGSPLGERKVELEGVAEAFASSWAFELDPTASDTAGEMHLRMLKQALPHVEKLLWDETPSEESMREAVMKEVEPLLAYHWRSALFQREHPVRPEEVREALERMAEMFFPKPPPEPESAPKPPKPKGTVIPLAAGAKGKGRGGRGKRGGKEEG